MPGPDPIRIGLLQCGHIPKDLDPPSGDYPSVFANLLEPHGVELASYDVTAADPPKIDEQDGWLVSGSPDSTYDRLPWIPPMEEFLRTAIAEASPLVAICFGHQLLAQALGGTVTRAGVGWGVGAHDYSFVERMPWMDPEHTGTVRLIASHQDQVTVLPAAAELLASTDHCPVAAFTVGTSALAIQPHPEFTPPLSAALIARRREAIGAQRADEAIASLTRPLDQQVVGAWMATFLRQAIG
jgi:GMP synthase-like glutamine amidotransferase